MKKMLLFILVSSFFSLSGFSQTYCYKFLYYVNDEGMKSGKGLYDCFYFTFNKNKDKCYRTDKDGYYDNRSGEFGKYHYIGHKGQILVYKQNATTLNDYGYLYFSSDYEKLNWDDPFDDFMPGYDKTNVRVFRRVDNPDLEGAPGKIW